MNAHILLVEDDNTTRQILASVLEVAGHRVTSAPNGTVALQLLEKDRFDVVVSDIRMREIDGVEVLNAARNIQFPPEVILLTGYGSLETAVAALRAGAFNYLLKPCASTELLECVEHAVWHHHSDQRRVEAMRILAQEFAHLQRPAHSGAGANMPALELAHTATPVLDERYLQVGALRLDLYQHTASFNSQPLHVTPIEYAMLCHLAQAPGRVHQCADIVRRTHGYDAIESEAQELLRTHVRNLRRKLPSAYLVTVRSSGYMLVCPGAPATGGDYSTMQKG